MKKKSSSKSAFFNFRVLLFLCLGGAFLVLVAFGGPGRSAGPQRAGQDQNGSLTLAQQPHANTLSPPDYAQQRASSSGFMLMEVPGESGATVTTDKPDYVPGGLIVLEAGLVRTEILNRETIMISGTGWTANQEVALHIDDSNGVARFDATDIADADGNIDAEFVIHPDDVGVAFTLTATQGDVSAFTQFTGVAGAASNGVPEGWVMQPDTVGCGVSTCTPPYPTPIPNCTLCNVAFNESEVLRAFVVSLASTCNASGTLQMFYNDEHALTLGISAITVKTNQGTTTTPYLLAAPPTATPSSASSPVMVGSTIPACSPQPNCVPNDQAGTDLVNRPMFPALFITDVTLNPNNPLAGDWQFGGAAIPPDAIFGTWKSATKLIDYTHNPTAITITEGGDPPQNNWNLGPGADAVPSPAPTNQGWGAECRWDLSKLGLIPGHQYRFYFMVHDGDQHQSGGDVGQACRFFISSAPTIGGQGSNATIECPATPSFTAPTASDTCGTVSVVQDSDTTAAGTCAGSYSRTKTWHAVDQCGNTTAAVSQTITVQDTTAPTIGQAGGNATIDCPNTPSFTAPTASDTCSGATVVQDSDNTVAGSCAGAYTETRTWHAVDGCGNISGTRTQTITVRDITPPTIGSPGAAATIQCPNSPSSSFTAPTASDTCDPNPQVVLDSDTTQAGACAGTYSETRTWHAVDACGNTSGQVHQTITVVDTTPPTIGSPGATATIQCPASPTFTAPTASDTCDPSAHVVLDSDNTTPGCGNTYTETKTWHAVDCSGNTSGQVSQTITVVDTTPPTIGNAGANSTIACDSAPSFTAPTASDACGGATVQLVSDSSTTQGENTVYTRTWNAVDACGNTSSTVSQTITSPFCCPNPLAPCTPPYPTPIPGNVRSNIAFNESEVLRGFTVSVGTDFCNPTGTLNLFYNDEHALTLGVRQTNAITCLGTTPTNYPFAAGPSGTPTSAFNPNVGAQESQGGTDPVGRPMFPSLYITDVTANPGNPLAGDWQFGGRALKPDAVFGTWKGAVISVNSITHTTTVTPDPDPPTNNWNLGPGADPVPPGLPNQGYGAECRWNLSSFGLIPGHQYRFYFIVHDGDQNHTGGDVGQACVYFLMSVHAPPPGPTPTATPVITPSPTPATIQAGGRVLTSKTVTVKLENDSGAAQVLTRLALLWHQVPNGNLSKVTFNGTTIYQTSTANPPGLNTTSLLGTTAQRTIASGSCGTLVFSFVNNVDTNASDYTGSAGFLSGQTVTTF